MISYYRFKIFLETHFLNPLFIIPQDYYPTYSTKIQGFNRNDADGKNFYHGRKYSQDFNGNCIFWYEEPLNSHDLEDLSNRTILIDNYGAPECREWYNCEIPSHGPIMYNVNIQIFANSEKSALKKQWIKNNPPMLDWYFFFHGFAALDWFRDFEYVQNICDYSISKVFICLNHVINNNRSYRLLLLSMLKEQNLLDSGIVSAPLLNQALVKEEVFSVDTRLSKDGKMHVMKNLYNEAEPIIVHKTDYEAASADIPDFFYQAFWNIVTETNFYDEKLHLTEKIFKPIVAKQPFVLLGCANNLQYLKSYGFKTFDSWWDESYDKTADPIQRLQQVVEIIERICSQSDTELQNTLIEMQSVLDHNYNLFYSKEFINSIWHELKINLQSAVAQLPLPPVLRTPIL